MNMDSKAPTSTYGSCDTFVCLPPATANNAVIFGKNSDRPRGEVQEIVRFPAKEYGSGTKLQCTYIEVEQVDKTVAVILSKPSWMWGAEMGANEHGVCIGNEAVWTKLNSSDDDMVERLLGMDLVRLGLERATTARKALDVITYLLEKYGQGGCCSDVVPDLVYHNSFLIADTTEAWVLETAGQLWAAERITSGFRNISNILSIGANIDLMSHKLKEKAKSLGLWKESDGEFNFAKVFGKEYESGSARLAAGRNLLKVTADGTFDVISMMGILRSQEFGICRSCSHPFPTTSSQISVLSPNLTCHWFTGTPDPRFSMFKPFIFPGSPSWTPQTVSPAFPPEEDPAKVEPRFQFTVDRRHPLYKAHGLWVGRVLKCANPTEHSLVRSVMDIEDSFVKKYNRAKLNLDTGGSSANGAAALDLMFHEAVDLEMKLYSKQN